MHILSVKKICSCYAHLLNSWNNFWNTYCNLPFLAIYRSLLHLLIFLVSPWYQKAKIELRMSLRHKKWLITILKDFIKQPVIKQSPTVLCFSFLIDCCISAFFSFLIQASFQDFIGKLLLHIKIEKIWKCENLKYFTQNL